MLYETMEIGPIYFNQINNLAVLYNQHEHFEQIKWKNTLSEVETEAITKKITVNITNVFTSYYFRSTRYSTTAISCTGYSGLGQLK